MADLLSDQLITFNLELKLKQTKDLKQFFLTHLFLLHILKVFVSIQFCILAQNILVLQTAAEDLPVVFVFQCLFDL